MDEKKTHHALCLLMLTAALGTSAFGAGLIGAGLVADGNEVTVYNDQSLDWQRVWYTDTDKSGMGSAQLHFGLFVPPGYDPAREQAYPVVLFLHDASARGSDLTDVLTLQTASHMAWLSQTDPNYAAFVIAPQVPSNQQFVQVPWNSGPYEQSESTYTNTMFLTERLMEYLFNPLNNDSLLNTLGIRVPDLHHGRVYLVGTSMGAYGAWDTLGARPDIYTAAVAASGSGPKNRLTEIRQVPLWTIHGATDSTVPNFLPDPNDLNYPDGGGTLGMLGLIDPNFTNTESTPRIKKDVYGNDQDDPTPADRLIYTQDPSSSHAAVAQRWTTRVPAAIPWLFSFTKPKIIYVSETAAGRNDGANWFDAFTDLQPALTQAQPGDQIWVARGIYQPSAEVGGAGPRFRAFQLRNGVTIYGGFPAEGDPRFTDRDPNRHPTVLSGDIGIPGDPNDNCCHLIYHPAGMNVDHTAVLDGFVITGGNADGPGDHASGGGIRLVASSPAIINCVLLANAASARGAGIDCDDHSAPDILNTVFVGNVSGSRGGALAASRQSAPTLTNCLFTGNAAIFGAALHVDPNSTLTVAASTFSGNLASGLGGALYASTAGSRVYGSILWNNAPAEIHGSALVEYSCVRGGFAGPGNIAADPRFADPNGLDDLRLLSDSPCIDAGPNHHLPMDRYDLDGDGVTLLEAIPYDLDGRSRLADDSAADSGIGVYPGASVVDMGAYEYPGAAPLVGDLDHDGDVDLDDFALFSENWLTTR